MNKPILFVGQCKQGSNSLFSILNEQKELCSGNNIRAMVCNSFTGNDYFSNWNGINTSDCKYLLDKSIINPSMYNYHVGDWKNHRMIYMFRNIYNVLRSQFLVVLAGEASYQHCIPYGDKEWNLDENSTLDKIMEVLEYNEQKFTHLNNIKTLPKDVFNINKNVFFCTFEDFKEDTTKMLKKVSEFIGVEIDIVNYPHVNQTAKDWYNGKMDKYYLYNSLFDKFQDEIYRKYVKYDEWEELSSITKIDLITKYRIK